MADRYWVGANNAQWTTTSTTVWSTTAGGAGGASVPTSADNVFFTTAGAYNVFIGGAVSCANLTISSGAPTIGLVSGSLTIYGSYSSHSAAASPTFYGPPITFAATTAQTINTNGVMFSSISNITFAGVGGSWQLQNNFAIDQQNNTVTFTNGTLDLNGKTFTCPIFSCSSSNTRTIAFGATGKIIINQNSNGATVFTTATIAGLTITGTPVVEVQMYSNYAATVIPGALPESQSISFLFTSGTGTATFLGNTGNTAKNVDFTGFAGIWGGRTLGHTIYGNLTLSTGMTVAASTGTLTLGATSGTQVITSNGKTYDGPVAIDGVGGTVQLADAFTVGSTRVLNLVNGTFDLNGKSATAGSFSSNYTNTRTIAFGTGSITCNGAGGTIFNTTIVTNLTVTGTPVVNISYSGSVATTVLTGAPTEAQSISFNFTAGTYSLTFLGTAAYAARSVNFTGFGGTWATIANSSYIYGDLTLSATMTTTATTNALYFGATSGTKNITSNGAVILFGINITGAGGTFKLIDAMTVGNASNIRQFALSAGTIDLNSKTLTCGTLNAGSASARGVTGPGTISIFGSGAGAFGFGSSPVVTFSGNPVVNLTYSGSLGTSGGWGLTPENGSVSLNVTAGTYTLTFGTAAGGESVKNINFTGFSGTWAARTVDLTIYGNLTFSSTMTVAGSTSSFIFGATSGTQTITSNTKSTASLININGVGGTVLLADNFTYGNGLTFTNGTFDANNKTITGSVTPVIAGGSVVIKNYSLAYTMSHNSGTLTLGSAISTGNYTLTAGTLDLAGFTLTTPSFITATGTKNLTFNAGTLAVTNATTTAWNNAQPTGFTTTAGTGTGKISMTAATAKTFVGGGSTYNCTLSNDGAGALTITGANTFTTIANGVQPTSFVFPSSTTTTVSSWSVSGTSGNLVTITSSTSGTAATLSKSSGTVSSNYLSLKDSAATGGATWYAGANSTNVSGNSGWLFSNAPVVSGGNFFFMF